MVTNGFIASITDNRYRVKVGNSLSMPISKLTSAYKINNLSEKLNPQIGDKVLCWFPGNFLRDGVIIGLVDD